MCGCGVADTDSDGDGTPNCNDDCPSRPDADGRVPVVRADQLRPEPINWSAPPVTTLNCGTTTVNTTDPDGTGPLVATITNWCGTRPCRSCRPDAAAAPRW